MPVVQAQQHRSIQEKQSAQAKPIILVTTSMEMEPKVSFVRERYLSAVSHQMPLDCMTCMATYGSGVLTGIMIDTTPSVQIQTLLDRQQAVVAFSAAAAGAALPTAAGLPAAAATAARAAATTASDFVFAWT